MNLVFLSEYSEENVNIGNCLCKNKMSTAGYWEGKKDIDSNIIKSNCGYLRSHPLDEKFANFISYFLWDIAFKPDCIIVKGSISDCWGVSSLIKEGLIRCPSFSIIDKMDDDYNFENFDFLILDQFDKNWIYCNEENVKNFEILNIMKNKKVFFSFFNKINILKEFSETFYNNILESISNNVFAKGISEIGFVNI